MIFGAVIFLFVPAIVLMRLGESCGAESCRAAMLAGLITWMLPIGLYALIAKALAGRSVQQLRPEEGIQARQRIVAAAGLLWVAVILGPVIGAACVTAAFMWWVGTQLPPTGAQLTALVVVLVPTIAGFLALMERAWYRVARKLFPDHVVRAVGGLLGGPR